MSEFEGDLPDRPIGDSEQLSANERLIIEALRAPVEVDSRAFDARVMAAIRNERAHEASVVRMHRGRVAAAVVLFGAVAAAVVFLAIGRDAQPSGGVPQARSAAVILSEQRNITFTLVASGASSVAVAGSFNGWSTAATPLRRVGKDTWAAEIPLGAGRYVYQFVIDGTRWVADPRAPRDAGDDFGASNSVVTVASSGSA